MKSGRGVLSPLTGVSTSASSAMAGAPPPRVRFCDYLWELLEVRE